MTIGAKNSTVTTIDQRVQFVGSKEGKIIALREIVKKGVTPPVLVFTEVLTLMSTLISNLELAVTSSYHPSVIPSVMPSVDLAEFLLYVPIFLSINLSTYQVHFCQSLNLSV